LKRAAHDKGGERAGLALVAPTAGLSTKIHAAGDALGNPVRRIGSPGQRNDIAFAHELVEGFAADVTIADKGYHADHLCDRIAGNRRPACHSAQAQPHRTFKRPYDAELYKERNTSNASSRS
jgi:putative transposase